MREKPQLRSASVHHFHTVVKGHQCQSDFKFAAQDAMEEDASENVVERHFYSMQMSSTMGVRKRVEYTKRDSAATKAQSNTKL